MSSAVAPVRRNRTLVLLTVALVTAALASTMFGVRNVTPGEMFDFLVGRATPSIQLLIMEFRLPRLLMALLAGVGISVSGAVFQALCRNDLAAPGLLGVSAAGRLGVIVAVALTPGLISPWILPAASFFSALVVTLIVLALSLHRGQLDPIRMILTGVAVSLSLGAVGEVLNAFLAAARFEVITAWLTASLARATWSYVSVLAVYMAVLTPLVWLRANSLNVMSLGDDAATGLGLLVNRSRLLWISGAVMLTAACSAFGGSFAFLGLLGPHIARRLVGRDYRRVIPASALTGALLLVVADALGRTCFRHNELPAGVMVSALGGVFFLVLLMKESE